MSRQYRPTSKAKDNLETKNETTKMTSILGLTPFKAALTFESLANIVSLPSLLLDPNTVLDLLTTSPTQRTTAARSLTQWFGGVMVFTVPLIVSWVESKSPNDAQAGF